MTPGPLLVRRAESAGDLHAAFALRTRVFVEEQNVPAEEERDAADRSPTTAHVVAERDGAVVGTGRLLADPDHPGEVHVGRVAVAAEARAGGVGEAVMAALEAIALAEHAVAGPDGARRVRVELSAQEQAVGFYRRLGYTLGGRRFLDAGIWHRDAVKVLTED
jgi:predicted GNAT family N-acyltransferase